MTVAEREATREEARRRLREDTVFWAKEFGYIVTKTGEKVLLEANAGQLAFDAALEAQRLAGKPMRAIVLKARQIGFSTWTQAKLIQRATQRAHYQTVVVAHDRDAGGKLYNIGQMLYGNLPADEDLNLKPEIASHRRSRFMHFANAAKEAWTRGDLWPDSTYLVDTAGEFEAGRGGTYQAVHASEVAFWEQPKAKLAALKNAVPEHPETLFIMESTANGHNFFKDEWELAVNGQSDYIAFFWPWWKEPSYSLAFLSEAERDAFHVGDGPYGDEEPALVDPGPPDPLTGKPTPLTLEQLNWRRHTISNQCSGDLRMFHQEYPSTPEEAFLSSGRQVFSPELTKLVLNSCAVTDPRLPGAQHPGPALGAFGASRYLTRPARSGTIEVPEGPRWESRGQTQLGASPWRLWLPNGVKAEDWNPGERPDNSEPDWQPPSYIISVDVSGGQMAETDEPDWHAIQVIGHESKEQVAEYHSRIDPDLLAEQVYLAALFFNRPWVAVEATGSWGLPILRQLKFDYKYPYVYQARRKDSSSERQESRLGWHTTAKTKPIIEAYMIELLRTGEHGIKSRGVAMEMNSYVRDEKGKTGAQPSRYDDLLVAYMIAQQVARELPLKAQRSSGVVRATQAPSAWPR